MLLERVIGGVSGKTVNVLFLCTGNSARSIIADPSSAVAKLRRVEAILDRRAGGRFHAYSAGSHPAGRVNPFALELLRRLDYPVAGLRSKSWDEFARTNSPRLDVIVTVCDRAAAETCPAWPSRPATVHWSVADPAAVAGDDDTKRAAFLSAYRDLADRIEAFAVGRTVGDGA